MKIRRYKRVGRYMSLFRNNFGFRTPYQVLLDATFCQVALDNKVNIQEQIPKYLGGECKLLTTPCVIHESQSLGNALYGATLIIKQFSARKCDHEKPISATQCLLSMVSRDGNKDHYFIATQDNKLRQMVRKSVVCPLLKLKNNTMIMEQPPQLLQETVESKHRTLTNCISSDQRELLDILKEEELDSDQERKEKKELKKKRKGPKGPNPLSCKKKRPTSKPDTTSDTKDKLSHTRKRKRVKIARHVRKLLQGELSQQEQ